MTDRAKSKTFRDLIEEHPTLGDLHDYEIAALMKFDPTYLAHLKSGRARPRRPNRRRICRVLGCSREELDAALKATAAEREP